MGRRGTALRLFSYNKCGEVGQKISGGDSAL